MSEQGTRIPLPILLRQRLQAFRSADDPDSDVCLKDPRSEQTHWLKPDQFFVLDALREAQTYEALEAAFLERFQRAMNRQEVDALLANVANLELFTRPAQSHPLVAPFAQQTSEVAPEAVPDNAPPTAGSTTRTGRSPSRQSASCPPTSGSAPRTSTRAWL